jgi:DTW domain-containing protein YfiP
MIKMTPLFLNTESSIWRRSDGNAALLAANAHPGRKQTLPWPGGKSQNQASWG